MDPILENLVNYGVLGLWTASLLWNNHITKKNFQSRYDNLNDDLKEGVKEIKRLLDCITIRMTSIENAYDDDSTNDKWVSTEVQPIGLIGALWHQVAKHIENKEVIKSESLEKK